MSNTHQVIIEFDDGVGVTLICPESGCTPSECCGFCGRQFDDPEGGAGCYDCKDADSWKDQCWIKTWFDNVDATELLHGKVTVSIDAEWDRDHMNAHII